MGLDGHFAESQPEPLANLTLYLAGLHLFILIEYPPQIFLWDTGAAVFHADDYFPGFSAATRGKVDNGTRGNEFEPYRSTDGTIFAVAEGQGTTVIDGKPFAWGINDVFVVPPWKRYQHNAATEAVLFSISDRPAQEALGIWREGN